jgi:hypothetical protein
MTYDFVMRWRALTWFRLWTVVLALAFAWSAGVGLAIESVLPAVQDGAICRPGALQPLVGSFTDLLWLPWHILVAVPYGLHESGGLVLLLTYLVLLYPAGRLRYGVAVRVLSLPPVAAVGAVLAYAGWWTEAHAVSASNEISCFYLWN